MCKSDCNCKQDNKNQCDDKQDVCDYCKQVFASEILPTLEVALSAPFEPYTTIDEVTGQFGGFDVELIKEVAKRMCFVKSVRFTNLPFGEGLFDAVRANDVDLIADSSVNITGERLSSNLAFVATNLQRQEVGVIVYSCEGLVGDTLGPNPDPETVLSLLASVNAAVVDQGEDSLQRLTLERLNPSYPADLITGDTRSINSAADLTALFLDYTALSNGTGFYFSNFTALDDDTLALIQEAGLCATTVALDVSAVGRGNGWTFSRESCALMLCVQKALDEVIEDGTYDAIIQRLIEDEVPGAADLLNLPVPGKCESVRRHFIPKACLANKFIPDLCKNCKTKCPQNRRIGVRIGTPDDF